MKVRQHQYCGFNMDEQWDVLDNSGSMKAVVKIYFGHLMVVTGHLSDGEKSEVENKIRK